MAPKKSLQVTAHLTSEMKCVKYFRNKLEFSGYYCQGETAVHKSEETLDIGSGMNWVAV